MESRWRPNLPQMYLLKSIKLDFWISFSLSSIGSQTKGTWSGESWTSLHTYLHLLMRNILRICNFHSLDFHTPLYFTFRFNANFTLLLKFMSPSTFISLATTSNPFANDIQLFLSAFWHIHTYTYVHLTHTHAFSQSLSNHFRINSCSDPCCISNSHIHSVIHTTFNSMFTHLMISSFPPSSRQWMDKWINQTRLVQKSLLFLLSFQEILHLSRWSCCISLSQILSFSINFRSFFSPLSRTFLPGAFVLQTSGLTFPFMVIKRTEEEQSRKWY